LHYLDAAVLNFLICTLVLCLLITIPFLVDLKVKRMDCKDCPHYEFFEEDHICHYHKQTMPDNEHACEEAI